MEHQDHCGLNAHRWQVTGKYGIHALANLARAVPFYEKSPHLITNERKVTLIKGSFCGETVSYYVNRIAGGSVRGIDSFVRPGMKVRAGESIFVESLTPHSSFEEEH
jgi:hypothetical protein